MVGPRAESSIKLHASAEMPADIEMEIKMEGIYQV
jgi:hypothetical protein